MNRRGWALVCTSGLMVLFLCAALTFMAGASFYRSSAVRQFREGESRLAAASGLEYAAARLATDDYPRHLDTPESRGDFWAPRDPRGTPIRLMRNPSYAHGEPWQDGIPLDADGIDNDADGLIDAPDDPTEGTGLFTPGEFWPPGDLDGDGRFSAWSGRVRGGRSPFDLRFTLKIESEDGKIPLNAGFLDAQNRLIGGNSWTGPIPINSIPDHCDPDADPYHLGLTHVLNNLGVVLRPAAAGPWTRRASCPVPGGGHIFEFSWLGDDLVANRPKGGYRSWQKARQVLVGLGYRPDECDLFEPFIDAGLPRGPAESARMSVPTFTRNFLGSDPYDFPPYAPVNFAAASREVLASLWMHLCSPQRDPNQLVYGESAGANTRSSRTGIPGLRFGGVPFPAQLPLTFLIFEDEAKELARRAVLERQGGSVSWQGLYQALINNASSLFPRDDADLASSTIYRNAWLQAKVDLAFRAVALDFPVYAGMASGSATWSGWGLDRDQNPANGVQQSSGVGTASLYRVTQPTVPGGPLPLMPFQTPDFPEVDKRIKPQGITLAPPTRFHVASLSSQGLAEGDLRTADCLAFTSQEDFENLAGGTFLARRGIAVHDDPPAEARRDPRTDNGRTYCAVMSLPRMNRRSLAGSAPSLQPPFYGCSRLHGALTLADRQRGLGDAQLYWPCAEDFDESAATDFQHEADPGFPWVPAAPLPVMFAQSVVANFGTPDGLHYGNPFHHRTVGTLPFDCPGITGRDIAHVGPSGEAANFSAEFWATPSPFFSSGLSQAMNKPEFSLSSNNGASWMELSILRGDLHHPGLFPDHTTFVVETDWEDPTGAREHLTTTWVVPPSAGTPPSNHHVVLTLESSPPSRTDLRLYVNGSDHSLQGSMVHWHPALMASGLGQRVELFSGLDEIRMYRRTLLPAEPGLLYAYDRFVRHGKYTSPLYVFDQPASLDRIQWTGFVPPDLRKAAGTPINPFTVTVEGYATTPADAGHPLPAWPPVSLGNSGRVERLPARSVKSFRYTVEMDCTDAAGVLDDTPVFESIWLTYRSPGTAPRWVRYR